MFAPVALQAEGRIARLEETLDGLLREVGYSRWKGDGCDSIVEVQHCALKLKARRCSTSMQRGVEDAQLRVCHRP